MSYDDDFDDEYELEDEDLELDRDEIAELLGEELEPGSKYVTCESCGGVGQLTSLLGQHIEICGYCNGSGVQVDVN